jgi:hypothetical protein
LTPILRRLTAPGSASDPDRVDSGDVVGELLEVAAQVDRLAQRAGVQSRNLRRHADGLRDSAKQLS